MRWEIKRIRELERTLRANNNADFEEEYVFLHAKLHRPFPKDFLIEDPYDSSIVIRKTKRRKK